MLSSQVQSNLNVLGSLQVGKLLGEPLEVLVIRNNPDEDNVLLEASLDGVHGVGVGSSDTDTSSHKDGSVVLVDGMLRAVGTVHEHGKGALAIFVKIVEERVGHTVVTLDQEGDLVASHSLGRLVDGEGVRLPGLSGALETVKVDVGTREEFPSLGVVDLDSDDSSLSANNLCHS